MGLNRYDPWGIPASSNIGRFQYTGQIWIPELGLYYYNARFYAPLLGWFLQVDPIGYKDGPHLYAYVGNDPVNGKDPSGLCVTVGDFPPENCPTSHPPSAVTSCVGRDCIYNPTWTPRAKPKAPGSEDVCDVQVDGTPSPTEAAKITKDERAALRLVLGPAAGQVVSMYRGADRLTRDGEWTGKSDGGGTANRTYGAVTRELGSPLSVSLWVAGVKEFSDSWFGEEGNSSYDPANGNPFNPLDEGNGDNPASQARITEGYKNCGV